MNTFQNTPFLFDYAKISETTELDVPLADVKSIQFVKHHEKYCSVYREQPKKCNELGLSESEGGAQFLCKALSLAIDVSHNIHLSNYEIRVVTDGFAIILFNYIKKCSFGGPVSYHDKQSLALSRAVLNTIALHNEEETILLANLFINKTHFLKSIVAIISKSIGVNDPMSIYDQITQLQNDFANDFRLI